MAFDGLCESYISAIEIEFSFFFFLGYLSPCGHIHKIKWNVFRRFSILVNQNLKPKEPRPNNVHGPLAFSIHTQIFRDLPYLISISIFFRDPGLLSRGIHIHSFIIPIQRPEPIEATTLASPPMRLLSTPIRLM